jgi:3-deoxy-manno-octulosonate cytidylyltransferase (CMP-KDO synthetase)
VSFAFQVVIPSRYQARRLPGKPLLDIGGITLIQHVYDAARNSQAERVIIATDDERIEDVARSFGAEVIMTAAEHNSGTDRITEVIKRKNYAEDMIVVNVQGDEFALPAALIDQVAKALNENPDKEMATLCEKITDLEDLENPNVVKVLRDINNTAIYFSRSAIPWQEKTSKVKELVSPIYRHIGIYAYRAGFLKRFSDLHACPLEEAEKLEQLRAIYNGYSIHVEEACAESGIGIDSEEDLERARKLYKS